MKKAFQHSDRNWLFYQYAYLQKSTCQIAKENNCSHVTVMRWLKKFSISCRNRAKAIYLATANHITLSQEAKEFIDGEMLGDMHIRQEHGYSARIGYGSQYEKYILWLSETLARYGIKQSGKIIVQKTNRIICNNKRPTNTIGFHYHSKSYIELAKFRERFYIDSKKVVPDNLKLTPLVCKQWYIGDGMLHKGYIELCTDSFSIVDIEKLVEKLHLLDFRCWRTKINRIHISKEHTPNFLKYIYPCPKGIESCYKYKWNIVR